MIRIKLPDEKKAHLRKTFGVSGVTVWKALNFITDSKLSRQIRQAAIQQGGEIEHVTVLPEGFMPNCGTRYERNEAGYVSKIEQLFPNDVLLEFDNRTCTAKLLHGGEVVCRYDRVAIDDWCGIVWEAQSLSNDAKTSQI